MLQHWKAFLDRLDKRPMSVLLGLTLGFACWILVCWRDEVEDHKKTLRMVNDSKDADNKILREQLRYLQKQNEHTCKTDTTQREPL